MSVAALLVGSGSVKPAPPGTVTVAVLVRSPVAAGSIVPVTVTVKALPAVRVAPLKATVLPAVLLIPQVPSPLVTTQLAPTPVIAAGTTSSMAKPTACEGPSLMTTIW